MRKIIIRGIGRVKYLAVVALMFAGCQTGAGQKGGTLSADDFEKKLSETNNYQLVDVRTPEEYNGGHLQNAANVDYNSGSFEQDITKLDKDKPTFVYCLSGGRSHKAAEYMRSNGFKTVYEMDGGIMAWNRLNKPLVTDQPKAETAAGLTPEDFQKAIKDNPVLLVDFSAVWCGPCKQLSPIVENIADEQKGKMTLLKVDVDQNQELSMKLGIENIPTVMIFKNGKMTWQHVGLTDKATIMAALGL